MNTGKKTINRIMAAVMIMYGLYFDDHFHDDQSSTLQSSAYLSR